MKPRLIIFCFYILSGSFNSIFCQTNLFEVGMEGGPGIANFYRANTYPEGTFEPIVAGYIDVTFQYHFSRHFSLKTGLSYEHKGTNCRFAIYGFRTNCMYYFNYLTIPLLLQAEYGKKVRFYANTGFYFSYLLNQKYSRKDDESGYVNFTPNNPNDTYNERKFDFGICAEVGTKITVSKGWAISLGICDHFGLYDTKKQLIFIDNNNSLVNPQTSSFNNVVILILGCSFKFGSIKN